VSNQRVKLTAKCQLLILLPGVIPMNGADDVVNGQKVSQAYALHPSYLNTGQCGTGTGLETQLQSMRHVDRAKRA